MVTTVRRIEPVSLAKIYAVITGAIMLLLAVPAGCMLVVMGGTMDEFGGMGVGVGLMMMIMYPIMGVIGGFVMGWVYGFVYNLVADRIGGVEIELDGLMEPDIL